VTDKPQLSGFFGRPARSTGIGELGGRSTVPVDRHAGSGFISADPLYEVFKPKGFLGFRISAKIVSALSTLAFKET